MREASRDAVAGLDMSGLSCPFRLRLGFRYAFTDDLAGMRDDAWLLHADNLRWDFGSEWLLALRAEICASARFEDDAGFGIAVTGFKHQAASRFQCQRPSDPLAGVNCSYMIGLENSQP